MKPAAAERAQTLDRFLRFIEVDPDSKCWTFRGGNDGRGRYGRFWFRGRMYAAHRAAFCLFKRTPRAGYVLLHACDRPACCNPEHLSEARQKANVRDMWQ